MDVDLAFADRPLRAVPGVFVNIAGVEPGEQRLQRPGKNYTQNALHPRPSSSAYVHVSTDGSCQKSDESETPRHSKYF